MSWNLEANHSFDLVKSSLNFFLLLETKKSAILHCLANYSYFPLCDHFSISSSDPIAVP